MFHVNVNMVHMKHPQGEVGCWLLLIHQLPAKPAYLRVKVWRRLQALGAVAIKNAVHALPATAETQEDFSWLRQEIADGGGEAMICEARFVDGLSDPEIRALFSQARDTDYHTLADEVRALAARIEAGPASLEPKAEALGELQRLRARLGAIVAIDYFGASGREVVAGLIGGLEAAMHAAGDEAPAQESDCDRFERRVWVTRQGVHVDRIASAWLIRRFIDREASFKFVLPRGYVPRPGELRFDMFEAEFTHQGDRCTFEVLLAAAPAQSGPPDRALRMIAEIVHDIDLKDGKFGHPETEGIRTTIAALCATCDDDDERLRRGALLLEDLYRYFQRQGR
jgi:hypothetical protein